jgi:phenylalanyl-tRNA synthetase beta chain
MVAGDACRVVITMPTIDVSHRDLCTLIGRRLSLKELREKAVLYAKGEIEEVTGDRLKIDIKDTNRPDLWSAEGVAREIAGRYGRLGIPHYHGKRSAIRVVVDPKVKKVRPHTVCAVVRNVHMTKEALSQLIQLQEKVSLTFGRNRAEVAIGVYDLHTIKSPIRYTTVKPEGIRFRPLEFRRELTPKEILEQHPKGKEFRHLLEGKEEYPLFIDAQNNVLSMPPIINSNYTGKVDTETRDVFVECSGFDHRFLEPALVVIVAALADRGGVVEMVEIECGSKKHITPQFPERKITVNVDYVSRVVGVKLTEKEICTLLERARCRVVQRGRVVDVYYPAYRQDVMHQRDVVEDALISYGYEKIEPAVPTIATVGSMESAEQFAESLSGTLVGLGLQEVMSYTLTNKQHLFNNMKIKPECIVEIENVVSVNWSVFRTWLLPGLLYFLSRNKHVIYPHKVFEIGTVVIQDPAKETKTRDVQRLACCMSDAEMGYEDISSILDGVLAGLGLSYRLLATVHPSFIKGRIAKVLVGNVVVGMVGEIHPGVLQNWDLEKPVAAFELDVDALRKTISVTTR